MLDELIQLLLFFLGQLRFGLVRIFIFAAIVLRAIPAGLGIPGLVVRGCRATGTLCGEGSDTLRCNEGRKLRLRQSHGGRSNAADALGGSPRESSKVAWPP